MEGMDSNPAQVPKRTSSADYQEEVDRAIVQGSLKILPAGIKGLKVKFSDR